MASTLKGQGAEIAALRRQGALLHSANDALKDANDALSDEVRRLSLEAEQRQQMLAQREALLAELQAESDRLRQALAAARQEYRDLEVCNRALSHDWEASQLALEALQQTLAQRMTAADHHEDDGRAGQPHTLPYLERRIAHYRGLWGQLKEQFADKTEQLDLCRKELFGCQEELLCAKRELAERELLWQEQQLVQQCRLVGQLHESALPALQDQSITPFLEELIAFSAATG